MAAQKKGPHQKNSKTDTVDRRTLSPIELRVILENIADAIVVQARDGRIMYANNTAAKLFSVPSPEAFLQLNQLAIAEQYDIFDEEGSLLPPAGSLNERAIAGEVDENGIVVRFKRKDTEEEMWLIIKSQPVFDADKNVTMVVNVLTDITQRKNAEMALQYHRLHDALTGLPNRRAFEEELASRLQHNAGNRPIALLFLDLDRFKMINDTLGHPIGDVLLKEATVRIQEAAKMAPMIARLGSDEFAILLDPAERPQEVILVAKALLRALEPAFLIDEHPLHIGCSIGISFYPQDGIDTLSLMKNGDTALHAAKEAGRNRYQLYQQYMHSQTSERFALEHQLRLALERNEFQAYYEPIFDLAQDKIVAVEALIRWFHPESGMIMPIQFLGLAEELGLIVPMDALMLKTASEQVRRWQKAGHSLMLSKNFSAQHFSQPSMAEDITELLLASGLDPNALKIEITESIAMQNIDRTIARIKELRKLGITITIDDFGTGHSTFTYLKRFPADALKIDKSFVKHCATSEPDAAIVRAIISMGHSLGLKVIAEGVETGQQFALLASLGCDYLQGYFIGRPMRAEAMTGILEAQATSIAS